MAKTLKLPPASCWIDRDDTTAELDELQNAVLVRDVDSCGSVVIGQGDASGPFHGGEVALHDKAFRFDIPPAKNALVDVDAAAKE